MLTDTVMNAQCPCCGSESPLHFRSRDYNRRTDQTVFHHYKCPGCGLIFLSPQPSNLDDYYDSEYHYIPDSIDFLESVASHERYKIDLITQHVSKGRLLELGPSMGCFSYLARQSNFETEAIEMDAACSRFLNEVVGIPTKNTSDIANALQTARPYDVIALWHVIEHLPAPWETLEVLVEKLAPGGIIVIAAPNPAAFQFQVLGRFWPHVDAPRHLMLIPHTLLERKMASLGMSTAFFTTNDAGGLGWNVFGWEFFLRNLTENVTAKNALGKLGRFIATLMRHWDREEGKGSAYTMIFRKGGQR